jgi:hypothetical protein
VTLCDDVNKMHPAPRLRIHIGKAGQAVQKPSDATGKEWNAPFETLE